MELLTLNIPRVCKPFASKYLRHAVTICGIPGSSSDDVTAKSLADDDKVSNKPGTLVPIRSRDIKLSHEPF